MSTYTHFFNASGLPEKYFLTPSHRNTMSYPILDEEWRHNGEALSTQIPCMGFGCCHEMAATRQRA